MKWLLVSTCTLALCCASVQASRLSEYIASPELRVKLQEVYGGRAIQRAEAFSRLLTPRAGTTDQQKIELVNNYFNNLTYSDDPRLWGEADYWANPLEFIGARGGDCEDYSISKYYTLMELGVDEKKLRLAYVKAVRYNQFHMVTLYFATPKSDPMVLDNINSRILPGSKRTDLIPVYSFDAKSIWIMKSRREGTLAGSADRLAQWTSMKTRFSSEQLRSPRREL
ncbi:transglutaminase-like cysteine peptidase [Aeromonas hydrophila]|uniref:transglutaminase-like cysteine peptidase n=1 Tax=Aeromonas hydrophila TaxID=644 RepID=UPI00256F272F|nr:transglutaminase-like cysteine peptidase [Aeromonas hydrophila]MDL5385994.1 transglutaminase-like cysteine peptidase [Aeromonas hydrophila]